MEHFEKSIIPVIESVYPSFTPLERTVADFFIHNTDESDLSARHVSELLYVSEASLSRFAKKCGYTGYREFVYRYQEGLNAALPGTDDHIKQVLNTYQELLNKSYSLADRAQIDRICHILTSKRRVYVYGLGSSGLSAQEMKLRCNRHYRQRTDTGGAACARSRKGKGSLYHSLYFPQLQRLRCLLR